MNDQNLVNKPVKVEQIIEALRCTSAPGGPIDDCEKCPFWKKENLTPEQSEQLGTDEWASCDIDRVSVAAADRLANDQSHIAALQEEIKALQKRLELSNAERDANTQRMIELEQGKDWIPVTERLPENETDVLIAFTRKSLNGDIYRCVGMAFHTDGKSNSEDSSYWWDHDNIDDLRYDEEVDAYLIPEGWWETVDFGENFTAVDVPVTHWMPLPEAPEVE